MYLREIKDLNDPFEGDLLYDLDEFYNNPIRNTKLDKNGIKNIFYETNQDMKNRVYIACFIKKLCEIRGLPVYRMIKDNSNFNLTYYSL